MTQSLTTIQPAPLATNAGDDDQLVELWLRKQRRLQVIDSEWARQ